MNSRKLFATVSEALVQKLEECGFPACRSRLFRFSKQDWPDKFNDSPILIVSKGQVASELECKDSKMHLVGVRFVLIDEAEFCDSCQTDPMDDFDDYVDRVRHCLCVLEARDVCLPGPYEFGGQAGQVIETDDPEQTRSSKQFMTTLDVTFRVCEIHEDDEEE